MSDQANTNVLSPDALREIVQERYGAAARVAVTGRGSSCCGGGGGPAGAKDPITRDLYGRDEAGQVPEAALLASMGCANPMAIAALQQGEVVLDLGSGGGIDVLLSARRVGPTGLVYGLDMTDDMLALAEKNRREAGVDNVRFLRGYIESIPLPDASVDVIISNCVVNLSANKEQVFREAFRVLRRGGRLAIADVILEQELPSQLARDLMAYVGCVAGALTRGACAAGLERAGFEAIDIEPFRRYTFADLDESARDSAVVRALTAAERAALDGQVMGAFVRARKPL